MRESALLLLPHPRPDPSSVAGRIFRTLARGAVYLAPPLAGMCVERLSGIGIDPAAERSRAGNDWAMRTEPRIERVEVLTGRRNREHDGQLQRSQVFAQPATRVARPCRGELRTRARVTTLHAARDCAATPAPMPTAIAPTSLAHSSRRRRRGAGTFSRPAHRLVPQAESELWTTARARYAGRRLIVVDHRPPPVQARSRIGSFLVGRRSRPVTQPPPANRVKSRP